MSLKENVIIVNLSISQWTARKHDPKATKEIETAHQARETGRFHKLLLKSETLDAIGKLCGKVRTYHYENTLPWGDNGERILPIEKYFEYVSEIGNQKMQLLDLVDKFVNTEYEQQKEKAKQRLNSMYNEGDYPTTNQIKQKFNIEVKMIPIAEGDDLRVNLQENVVDLMRQQITKEVTARVDVAINDLIERLRKVVSHMGETLKDPDKKFHDSLVGNIAHLVETIPSLNFNNNEKVNEAVEMCKSICYINPDKLRFNAQIRKAYAEKARVVLDSL